MLNRYQRKKPKNINETYRIFFDTLSLYSLEALIKAAFDVFGLPVVLNDENSTLLYQYPQKLLGDQKWDMFITEKALRPDLLELYQKKFLGDKPADFEPFLYVSDDEEEGRYLFGQILYRGKNYGYFTVFMFDNSPDKYDLERAKVLSNALGIILYQRNITSSVSLNSLLYDILSREKSESSRLNSVAALNKHVKGDFIIMVKPIGIKANQNAYATMSVRRMPSSYSNLVMTIYNNCIVVLYCNIHKKDYMTTEYKAIASIESFIRPAGESCGVSALFSEINDISNYYQQAYITALYSKNALEFYEHIAPDPIFQIAAHYSYAPAFIHPTLDIIHQYDSENGTEYFETLRMYSLFMHNKKRTASELCIHRTTLLYRLNRIEELFQLPLEEQQTALYLLNSFQLWNVVHKKAYNYKAIPPVKYL